MNMKDFTRLGPSVSTLPKEKSWNELGRSEIAQIFVWHDEVINAIQFQYVEDGELVLSEIFGSDLETTKFHSVQLNYPSEKIIGISGHYHNRHVITGAVSSLKVVTNHKTFGPYGCADRYDEEFEYEVGNGNFGGFHGIYHSSSLRFIGIYFRPAMNLSSLGLIEEPEKTKVGNICDRLGPSEDAVVKSRQLTAPERRFVIRKD